MLIIVTGVMVGACSLLPGDDTEPDPPSQAGLYPSPYTEPSVSPDGTHIFFLREKVTHIYRGAISYSTDPDSTGIWMMETDGGNPRMLLRGRWYHNPSLSPDGNWLLFGEGGVIFKVPFDGEQVDTAGVVQLTHEGRNFYPEWSPDGQWIAYNQSICSEVKPCGVWLLSDVSMEEKFIAKFGNYPDWHPWKNIILYRTRVIKPNGEAIGDSLWTYDFEGSNSKNFAFFSGDNRTLSYSPDGAKIAMSSGSQVVVADHDGGNLNTLTSFGGGDPAWTPDGQIVYIHYDVGEFARDNGTIWIMNADGSGKTQLSYNHGLELQ